MVEIVNKMSTLHIHIVTLTVFSNSHYGYYKLFCMVDYVIPYVYAVAREMFTPCDEIAFTNRKTNTISGVLCIADTFV